MRRKAKQLRIARKDMEKVFIVHYGEIGLKGRNRRFFENRLVRNIRQAIEATEYVDVQRIHGRIVVKLGANSDTAEIQRRLGAVMGIAHFELCREADQNMEAIKRGALEWIRGREFQTLKVETRRANKRFPLTSPQISAEVGGYLLKHTGAKADMHHPDLVCWIEIVEDSAYIYADKIRGIGGLPVGVSGKALVMLSGGIDSPVAAWRMMKRGAKSIFVHFHSYPYTDKASLEKAMELVGILAASNHRSRVHLVPFAEIQREIVTKTPAPFRVILYRRMMVRIAERIAAQEGAAALVTGESLGQVASQTLANLKVIEDAARLPILRPLIGDDKEEIVNLARRIGTFDVSTLPHQDCCSLFVPDHPATNAAIEDVQAAERALEIDSLVDQALEGVDKKMVESPFS